MTKRASNILSERELRKRFEHETGCVAMRGEDRYGKNGRPTADYFHYLERLVRIYGVELFAMRDRDNKKTIAAAEQRRKQATIFEGGMQ